MRPPTLTFRSKSAATTYSFGTVLSGWGWALCTINDETGELNILSDWGNWAYRWHPAHTGCPSLTHFISGRSADHLHYLADKLTSEERHKRKTFSPEKTVQALRERVCRRRLEDDRSTGKTPSSADYWKAVKRFTREDARELYDDLAEVLTHDVADERDFVDRLHETVSADLDILGFDPCEDLRYEPAGTYIVLLHSILPALVAACNAAVSEREAVLDVAYSEAG